MKTNKTLKGESMDLNKGLLFGIFFAIAAIMVVAIVAIGVTGDNKENNNQQNALSVSGTQVLEVAPDQAVIMLSVETRGKDAATVSAENKAIMQKVNAALLAQGLAKDQIETTGFTLQRWYEWNGKDQTNEDKGYLQQNTIKITTDNLDKVGAIIDAAVLAGANNVQDVNFKLKTATEEQYKQQALVQATAIARAKAETLAKAADTKLGKVTSISESGGYQPYYYNSKADVGMMNAGGSTQISPQKVSLSMTVSMTYDIGHDGRY